MVYVNSTRTASHGLFDRISGLISALKLSAQRRRVYAQTLSELAALSDRDLLDLGLNRATISEVAHEAAYGN